MTYLDNTPLFKAQSALVNAMQISEQYQVKHELKKQTELMFKPFAPLNNATHNPSMLLEKIRNLIEQGKYEEAEVTCKMLINLCLQGLRYLQTYDWLFLRSIVTAGFLGWITYSLSFTLKEYVIDESSKSFRQIYPTWAKQIGDGWANLIPICALLLFLVLYLQESPKTYYAYAAFSVFFWRVAAKESGTFFKGLSIALNHRSWAAVAGYIVGYVAALEVLVYSYFERGTLSSCLILAAIWPIAMPSNFKSKNKQLLLMWSGSCLISSIFMLLPVEKGENILLVIIGGFLITMTGLLALWKSNDFMIGSHHNAKRVVAFQIGLVFLSTILVYDTTSKLKAKAGLPWLNQIVGWTILVIATLTPFLYGLRSEQHYLHRLTNIFLAFAPLFVILSISYEVLFYYFFSITLFLWLELERKIYSSEIQESHVSSKSLRKLSMRDIRVSIFFLFFIKVAFFGTGNVASLASFSLQSVYRLTTIFNPFLMGSLLLGKILIPFFIVSAVFGVVNKTLALPPFSLFLLVLSTSDVMTLNFFYLVRDDGSWLEIGTTISHYCISCLFSLFMILLFWLSELLIGGVLIPDIEMRKLK